MKEWSHPARGAWIEICQIIPSRRDSHRSHPARGAWIEIQRPSSGRQIRPSRTPQGARGLKFQVFGGNLISELVAPRKGRVD